MGVRWRTSFDKLPEMAANAERLNGKKVKVGVFNGEHQW